MIKIVQSKIRGISHIFLLLIIITPFSSCVEDEGGTIPVYTDLLVDKSSIDFGPTILGEMSTQSYLISASEISSNVTLSVDGNQAFSISKTSDGDFSNSLTFSSGELEDGLVTVFIRFLTATEGDFSASIIHSSSELTVSPTVTLEGSGITDPDAIPVILFEEDFDYSGQSFLPTMNRATDDSNPTLEGWLKVRPNNKDCELATTGLTFAGYPAATAGNGAAILDRNPAVAGANANLWQHNITPQQDAEFVGSYYMSFLMLIEDAPSGAGGFNSPLKFASWNTANGASWWAPGFLVQNDKSDAADPDNLVVGIRREAIRELSAKTVETGKTYLCVLKYTVTEPIPNELVATTTASASIFVFEEGDAIDTENEPTPVYTMEMVEDKHYIRSVALFQENNVDGRYIIDGIRVTPKWEDIFK